MTRALAAFFVALPAAAQHAGHGAPDARTDAAGAMPEGYGVAEISPERQQLIGLKTAPAQRGLVSGAVRAAAVVQTDETREAHVHSKLEGWVQELFVNAVGQKVTRGQPLYSLYSQELFAAQEEYLRARHATPDLARAARSRLKLWDVPEDQIALVEKQGPRRAITFRAPRSGTVIEKNVLQGHFVNPDEMLYRIADLSVVWILAEVYEYEVNRLDRAGAATVTVQGVLQPVIASIDYVYPTVDPVTRTVRVRMVALNADGRLRPGSFATAELPVVAVEALWVPAEAVIDTGVRQVVYVALGEGRFRPTLVKVGRRAEGRVEIREGLRAGDQVVVSAQFLVDSESRLRGVTQPGGHGGHGG